MDLTWFILIAMSLVTTVLLMGMIILGARNQKKMKTLEEDLGTSTTTLKHSASNLQNSAGELLQALRETRQEQERIMNRLENLEAIVTSEAWEALNAGKTEEARLLLDEDTPPEPTTEEMARRLARRTR